MIKETDLRLGNIISDFGDGHGVVKSIEDGWVSTTANPVPQPIETFSPIELSPDWLERLGYTYRNEHKGAGCILDHPNDSSIGITSDGKFKFLLLWKAPLEYVHQLQNLVFSMTGEELITGEKEGGSMSTYSVLLKTHEREDLTANYLFINNCKVHKCKPTVMRIVAGKRKENHFVVTCKSDECSKISMESADQVVQIWNSYNLY